MQLLLSLSGFMITREDWENLDDDTRELFTAMLKDEGQDLSFSYPEGQSAHAAQ